MRPWRKSPRLPLPLLLLPPHPLPRLPRLPLNAPTIGVVVVPVVDRVDADVVAPVAIAVPVSLATRTSPTC